MRGDLQRILEELLSLKEITKNAEQCQKCKMATSMTVGNEMHCRPMNATIALEFVDVRCNLNVVFETLNLKHGCML